MKIPYADPANTKSKPADILRDADELHSRELREAVAKYIEAQRERLKALRRLLH